MVVQFTWTMLLWSDYIRHISAPFSRLAEAQLTVNLAKCEFVKVTVTFLGQVVGQGQVHTVNVTVQVIMQYHVPATEKALMWFLLLCLL